MLGGRTFTGGALDEVQTATSHGTSRHAAPRVSTPVGISRKHQPSTPGRNASHAGEFPHRRDGPRPLEPTSNVRARFDFSRAIRYVVVRLGASPRVELRPVLSGADHRGSL